MIARAAIALTLIAIALAANVAGSASVIQPQDDAARVRAAVSHGQVLPLPHILTIAQRRVRGEVLKVELEEASRQIVYELKVLTPDGRVREMKIDARTGQVLKVEDD